MPCLIFLAITDTISFIGLELDDKSEHFRTNTFVNCPGPGEMRVINIKDRLPSLPPSLAFQNHAIHLPVHFSDDIELSDYQGPVG